MRLVDAEIIEKQFDPNTWQGEVMIAITKELPTAYDTEKVIKELEKSSYEHFDTPSYTDARQLDLDNAIEIVSGGGVDE